VSRIPSYINWIVEIWHFGVDSIDEYNGKEFHVTFEEAMTDLVRIYTKSLHLATLSMYEYEMIPLTIEAEALYII
jgi:hypothetical protein